jgi:glycosyltransferase involved in cell wall biosynthesis
MPVYNAERFLEQAVESILAQSFADFEFLIVDDGSTDSSLAILQEYAAADPRIRVVSRPNTGYLIALNEMLGRARGEFLARMDADDVALPERFAAQVEYLREHPECVVVGSTVRFIDEVGRQAGLGHAPLGEDGRQTELGREPRGHEELEDEGLSGSCPICHPTVLMRREAVLRIGGYRHEAYLCEDMDLWLRLAEIGKLASLTQVLLHYRLHSKSVSERCQDTQRDRMRWVSNDACARRGIAPRFVARPPWRPVDRASLQRQALWFGWSAFLRGDRTGAWQCGLKALCIRPWGEEAWRLLACALLKPAPASSLSPGQATHVGSGSPIKRA